MEIPRGISCPQAMRIQIPVTKISKQEGLIQKSHRQKILLAISSGGLKIFGSSTDHR